MLPNHVLIIPDGNRRYAEKNKIGIGVIYKHISDNVTTKLLKHLLLSKAIPELTFFGISRDNVVKREEEDLQSIYEAQIKLYSNWLNDSELNKKVRFNFIGDKVLLPKNYQKIMNELEDTTKSNNGKVCNILVAYNGQWEIENALKKILKETKTSSISKNLELKNDVDLVIRTGREKRFSTAPLYQIAYAELFFLEEYYPNLTIEKIDSILEQFKNTKRRFGK